MADAIHFDASAARAYVKFAFPGAHATVYLEVGYMVPASSLTAMVTAADAASGFGPAFCGVASDIASNPFGGFPNFAQDIFPVDSDINGTFDQFGDEYASTVNVTHTLVADTPFVMKTLVKHTGTGAYYAVDSNTASDLTTGLDMDGIWVGINTGGGTHTGYTAWATYIKAGTSDGASDLLDFDASTASDLSAFTVSGTVTLTTMSGGGTLTDPEGVCVAFGTAALDPAPAWVRLD